MAIRGPNGAKPIVVLGTVSTLSALLLTWVYIATSQRIKRQREEALISSLRQVLPQARWFEKVETLDVWIGYDDNNRKIGIAFACAPRGYAGPIGILCGLALDKKVTGLRIATPAEGLKETPGLGLKIREEGFLRQFAGLAKEEIKIKREGGSIEAITAATISSKAVADGVREGIARYQDFLK